MLSQIPFRDNDRCLLLWIPEIAAVEALSKRLSRGILVALGDQDAVRAARRAASHLENVMFVNASAEEIPWRDNLFTVIAAQIDDWPSPSHAVRELTRVLEPEGRLYLEECRFPDRLLEAGFRAIDTTNRAFRLEKAPLRPAAVHLPVLRG